MGLENREGGKYISIFAGKLTQRVPEGTEGAVSRVNKNSKTVFEKYYDSFVGKLVKIATQESAQYGKSWVFSFQDNEGVYHLQLPYSNSYAKAFLKMLPHIDLEKEMRVSPSQKIEDGKTKSSLFVNQNGEYKKQAYTKEKPNGMPAMEQVMVKGSLVWDDSKQLAFLEEMVNRDIIPKLPKASETVTSAPAKSAKDVLDEEFGDDKNKTTDDNDF